MMLREAAQQALAFIRWSQFGECRTDGWDGPPPKAHEVEAALKAALAEPQREPVAWQWLDTAHFRKKIPADSTPSEWRPLYTAPPQRKENNND